MTVRLYDPELPEPEPEPRSEGPALPRRGGGVTTLATLREARRRLTPPGSEDAEAIFDALDKEGAE